jgi:M6 family metalloprotease domain
MKIRILLIIALLTCSLQAFAVKGYPFAVEVVQPDGSRLTIRITGDESFSYKTSEDGFIIAQGPDGFYYYADYNSGILNVSGIRVSSSGSGYAKTIPAIAYSFINGSGRGPARTMSIPARTKAAPVTMKTLVIPVNFSDRPLTTPTVRSRIFNLFNQLNYSDDGATGSVRDYFRDNVGDACDFTFTVCDPVSLPNTVAYYGGNSSVSADANIRQFVKDACNLAHDAGVDFSEFDSNGDGLVDNVFLIFAGHNEAEGGGDDCIWPMSWNISDQQFYLDGKKIANFACYSEFSGAEGSDFAGIGTICHEYCHYLGLLDMYDVNGEIEGLSNGLCGTTSIMDYGNYNDKGRTPPYLNIVEREMLGLSKMKVIDSPGQMVIPHVHSSDTAYVFRTSQANEYFYLESRDDSKWDKFAGGTGLVVYHVDRGIGMAGSMSAKARWQNNAVNCCAAHECVRPISSVGGKAVAAYDIFFPGEGNVTAIVSNKTFPLVDWNGTGVGFGLEDISISALGAHASITLDDAWDLPLVTGHSVEPDQRSALLRWDSDRTSAEGRWVVVWGMKSTVESDTVAVDQQQLMLNSLEPGAEYWCRIFYERNGRDGKPYNLEFKTARMLSVFPIIAEMDNSHYVGETLRLHLLNVTEEIILMEWYFAGHQVSSNGFELTAAGTFELKAVVTYADGSKETIWKNMIVKEEK